MSLYNAQILVELLLLVCTTCNIGHKRNMRCKSFWQTARSNSSHKQPQQCMQYYILWLYMYQEGKQNGIFNWCVASQQWKLLASAKSAITDQVIGTNGVCMMCSYGILMIFMHWYLHIEWPFAILLRVYLQIVDGGVYTCTGCLLHAFRFLVQLLTQ